LPFLKSRVSSNRRKVGKAGRGHKVVDWVQRKDKRGKLLRLKREEGGEIGLKMARIISRNEVGRQDRLLRWTLWAPSDISLGLTSALGEQGSKMREGGKDNDIKKRL